MAIFSSRFTRPQSKRRINVSASALSLEKKLVFFICIQKSRSSWLQNSIKKGPPKKKKKERPSSGTENQRNRSNESHKGKEDPQGQESGPLLYDESDSTAGTGNESERWMEMRSNHKDKYFPFKSRPKPPHEGMMY